MINKLLLATNNQGKVKEIIPMVSDYFSEVICLADLPDKIDVEETGSTFEQNSKLKAETLYKLTGYPTLADDSGLEVDALDGAPGVYSARFSGDDATDERNNLKLIEMLKGLPHNLRSAKFRCVMAFTKDGVTRTFSGLVEGYIQTEMEGKEGFGYDPLFVPLGYDKSFGILGSPVKKKISHRTKALKKFVKFLG